MQFLYKHPIFNILNCYTLILKSNNSQHILSKNKIYIKNEIIWAMTIYINNLSEKKNIHQWGQIKNSPKYYNNFKYKNQII